jgi:hypothetical protein
MQIYLQYLVVPNKMEQVFKQKLLKESSYYFISKLCRKLLENNTNENHLGEYITVPSHTKCHIAMSHSCVLSKKEKLIEFISKV